MKTHCSFGLTILAVCGLLVSNGGCGQKNVDATPVAAVLPAAAEFAATAPGLARLFDHFSVAERTVFGRPVPAAEWERRLGFNPLSLAAWTERGIDVERPVGLGMGDPMLRPDGSMDFAVLVCLPATDMAKARAAAHDVVARAFPDAVVAEEPPFFRFSSAERDVRGAVGGRDGYLLLAFGPGGSAMPLIRSAKDGEASLEKTEVWRAASARTKPEDDLLLLADLEPLRRRLEAAKDDGRFAAGGLFDRLVRYARDYRHGAAWLDLDATDLAVRGLLAVRAGSPVRKLMTGVRRGREPLLAVPSPPLLLSLGSLDPAAYLETLRANMNPEERVAFDARLAEWGARFGIDAERDVIANLTGGFGIGVYDGFSLNMANYNTLVSAGVKDEAAARRTLAAAAARLSEQGGMTVEETTVGETEAVAVNVLGFFQIYAGVDDGRFLLSAGRRMFQEAATGGDPPPAPDPAVAEAWAKDPAVFFLDVDELVKASRNFAFLLTQLNRGRPVDRRTTEPLRNFRYVMSTSAPAGEGLLAGEFRVATRFSEPFFKGLRKVTDALAESRAGSEEAPETSASAPPARSE